MKKIIILIVLSLFCIGCEARYELIINEDLTVTENITGLEDEEFYDNYYNSTKERVISFMTEMKDEYLNEIGYSKEIVFDDSLTGAVASKTFDTLEEYFEKSQAYTQFYESWSHSIRNGVATIKLENQLLRNEDSIERYLIDNCNVSITLPFKVTKSNADSVDEKSNTYYWELNDKETKDIYIKFDTKKMANYEERSYLDYVFISLLLIGIGIVVYVIYNKNKMNNKID